MAGPPMRQRPTDCVEPGREGLYDYWQNFVRPRDAGMYAGLPTNAAKMSLNEHGGVGRAGSANHCLAEVCDRPDHNQPFSADRANPGGEMGTRVGCIGC